MDSNNEPLRLWLGLDPWSKITTAVKLIYRKLTNKQARW